MHGKRKILDTHGRRAAGMSERIFMADDGRKQETCCGDGVCCEAEEVGVGEVDGGTGDGPSPEIGKRLWIERGGPGEETGRIRGVLVNSESK